MGLNSGMKLGSYEVQAPLGAGGMGEVYRARDTRLGREVAIKVLPDPFARDAERLARFQREAQLLASLNHPNIAAIYGLEEHAGARYLVLEYVPGDTLAERVRSGPLRIEEALEIGKQTADALEAAHEKGIIHRDLKPANVKITPEGKVKVLDFGLAKATGVAASASDIGNSPTLTAAAATRAGIILGTAAYMSPEQARGKEVDRRTDIWSFGCLLYELLAGRRAFGGETVSDSIAAVLGQEPDWESLSETVPRNIRLLLRRCLAKDPRSRLHDIADARLELEDTVAGRTTAAMLPVEKVERRESGVRVLAAVAAGLLIGAAALGIWAWRSARAAAPPRVARFSFDLPQGSRLVPGFDVHLTFSRDSNTLLYPVTFPPPMVIHARRVDELEGKPLPDAKGFGRPLYSPDGRWLAMTDPGKGALVKLPLRGGAPVPLAPIEMPFQGDWGTDGYIYWTNQLISGVIRIPDSGGKSEPVTELDASKQERNHRFAKLLPGGKALMFTVTSAGMNSYDEARIDVIDLATKKRKPLVQGGTGARYSPSGHIVYARGGSLYAVDFDHRALEVTGTPVKVVDSVLMSTNVGTAYFDISPRGDLAYAVGPAENGERTLYWVDRQGKETPLPLPARSYLNPRISPDGKLLAMEVEGPNHDFYVYDFARAVMSRITNDGRSHAPIWSPAGDRIAFRTWQGGKMTLAWMPADRSGPEERLVNYPAWQSAVSFSPDGKYLAFDQIEPDYVMGVPQMVPSLWVLPLTGDRVPRPLYKSNFPVGAGKFSPDGKWVVYCSLESGKPEVYVQPWPGPGPRIQISSEGGTDPLWRRDGKEIFYRNASKMMAVPVDTQPSFRAERPQLLWEREYMHGLSSSCGAKGVTTTSYDLSVDGQRFLMIKDNDEKMYATKIVVVVNWAEELKQMMSEASGLSRK